VREWLSLSDLEPAAQEQVIGVLADEAEASGDTGPLERTLAGGDLLGDRDPAAVPKHVRDQIAQVLTGAIDDAG
jgi:hypothetical protein